MAESNQPAENASARLAVAYLRVFGSKDGDRNADQRLVWRDIESFCHAYRMSPEIVAGGDLSVNNLLVNEGRRSYWLRARGQVLAATGAPREPLKVNRRRTAKP